jgi:hypothetical protein
MLTALLTGLLAPSGAAEDVITIYLKDGTRVIGVIVKETEDFVRLRLEDDSVREIPAAQVLDFAFGAHPEDGSGSGGAGEPEDAPIPPGVIIEEDDIPQGPRSPRPQRPRPASPAQPGPAADPSASQPGAAAPASDPEPRELTLHVPEFKPEDCPMCGGYKARECWVCQGSGRVSGAEGSQRCHICRGAGKVRCEGCGGSGDSLDPSRAFLCPGCARSVKYAFAPGRWACPACNGLGSYQVIGQSKESSCKVCGGDGTFPCVICGGKAIVPRLFPPSTRPSPERWQERCRTGLQAIKASDLLQGDSVELADLLFPARDIPALRAMAGRLEELEKRAENLSKSMIQGSAEAARFFQMATGQAVAATLTVEQDLLETEEGYLEGGDGP